jgi:hypothetical protein
MNNKGIALVTVIVVLAILGALVTSLMFTSMNSFFLSANYKQTISDFYASDGISNVEDLDVITISVSDISKPSVIKDSQGSIPGTNTTYSSQIKYNFYKPAVVPGTSLNMFNDFFYTVTVTKGRVNIRKFVSKIGPKM